MKKRLYILVVFIMIIIAFVIYTPKAQEVDIYAGDLGIQLLIAEHLLQYKDVRLDGEISSFDSDGKYIIHNSPIGYYFYALFYLLGGKTITGYLNVYFILGILQAILLFWFGFLVIGPSSGLVILSLALFSRGAVMLAGFPSQMTNSMFIESVAIGTFGLYISSLKPVWFWVACLLSLLATQLYPPMYLLIIPKIILFCYYVRRIPLSLISLLFVGMISLYIYVPLIIQEYLYRWNNLVALRDFLSQSGGTLGALEIVRRFGTNIHLLLSPLSWFFSWHITWIVISCVFLSVVFFRKKLRVVQFIFILMMLLIPAIILALHPSQPYMIPRRAYLLIIFPYVWLFVGNVMALFPKKFVYLTIALFVVVSVWVIRDSKHYNSKPTDTPIRNVISAVVEDMKTRRVGVDTIDLFVISPDNSRNWDAGLYWYELERMTSKRLSRIAYESSTAVRISQHPVHTIYLICHLIELEDVEKQCKLLFEQERMEHAYGAIYHLVYFKQVMGRSYFVYQK